MRYVAVLVLLASPGPLAALCAENTLVSCPVGGGDRLEVCFDPEGFSYSFGPEVAPELALFAAYEDLPVTPWSGFGRTIWSSVVFRNADYAYEVYVSLDKLMEEGAPEPQPQAGVLVLDATETVIAEFACAEGTVTADPFAASDAMFAAGYCWDFEGHAWRPDGDCPQG